MRELRIEHRFVLTAGAALLLCMAASISAASEPATSHHIDSPIVFVQLPAGSNVEKQPGRAGGMLRAVYGDGGRIVRLDPDGRLQVLTEEFDSACELDVSFDAQRILFTAKRNRQDPWNIWEMNADRSKARQITRDLGDCRSPAYQATLYTIISTEPWYQIMFASDAAGMMNEYGSGVATSLYSCRLDGSAVRRLTMNLSDDMDPFLMNDGRVLLASWRRMDLRRGPLGRVSLFGVNTDGADYALFSGDQGERVKHMPCVTTDGLAVFVEAPSVPWDGAGHLASVTLRRNFYSHRRITHESDRRYHSPSPLRDGAVLVSSRSEAEGSTHGIYRLDPHTGEKKLVFDDPAYHDIHTRVLAPRAEPDGRSSVVNEKYPTGKLYCLNAYLTDPPLTPQMKPGIIKNLRVIEGVPQPADAVSASPPDALRYSERIVKKRLLGVVPVEEDGSFHIEVPADTPIQLQTLDADGLALRTCGWIWVKHREPRGCIGCHEDPELTPENRFVEALKRPGMKLMLPAEKRRTVDFRRDVVPIIAEKCTRCHTGADGGVDLRTHAQGRFSRAYETLVAPSEAAAAAGKQCGGRYVHVGQARTSPVLWHILGRNTSRPWDEAYRPGEQYPTCPPLEAKQLTDDEKLTFIEWIDLGAHWDGIPEVIRQPASPDRGVENEGEK